MLKLNKEVRLANKIKKMLNKRGFIVKIQFSKSSKSVYLKIDNGACSGVRISNHLNSKSNYKYNMIKNYQGKRCSFANGKTRYFYNYNSIGRVITDLESERSNNVIKQGYYKYRKIRDRENSNYYGPNKIAA